MSDSALTSSPSLVSSSSGLAVAHGPGVLLSHHSGPYPFLVDGCSFVKYHQQPSLFNHSGKRLMFYQHNFLFWLKPGVGRPRPGEEHTVDQQYQAPLTHIQAVRSGKHEPCFTQVSRRRRHCRATLRGLGWSAHFCSSHVCFSLYGRCVLSASRPSLCPRSARGRC